MVRLRAIFINVFILLVPYTGYNQGTSKDNLTGAWESTTSWSSTSWGGPPTGTPQTTGLTSVTIYGYITRVGDLEFGSGTLTVYDTLVIIGNLSFKNTADLLINDGGILIIRGNLDTKNKIDITANAYLIVTGNFTHTGSQGDLNSNDSPANVFVTGIPSGMNGNVTDCPGGTGYQTGCNYGNVGQDLIDDPIYPFFSTTCPGSPTAPSATGNSRCEAGILTLTSSGAGSNENYKWYSASSGGTLLQTNGAAYTTPIISSTTVYYVSKYNTITSCESSRSAVTATIYTTPAQPGAFTTSSAVVCKGQSNVQYAIPNNPSVTYSWSYTVGSGASISGSGNSVLVSFNSTATNGTLNVVAINGLCTSTARTINISVESLPPTSLIHHD